MPIPLLITRTSENYCSVTALFQTLKKILAIVKKTNEAEKDYLMWLFIKIALLSKELSLGWISLEPLLYAMKEKLSFGYCVFISKLLNLKRKILDKMPLTDYEEIRKAAIIYRESHTLAETAKVFLKTPKTIVLWCKKYKETGLLTKEPRGGKTHCIVDEEGERFILETVEKENDLTLKKICQRYLERFGILIGQSTVDYYLRKNNVTLKKKVSTIRNEKNYQRK